MTNFSSYWKFIPGGFKMIPPDEEVKKGDLLLIWGYNVLTDHPNYSPTFFSVMETAPANKAKGVCVLYMTPKADDGTGKPWPHVGEIFPQSQIYET